MQEYTATGSGPHKILGQNFDSFASMPANGFSAASRMADGYGY